MQATSNGNTWTVIERNEWSVRRKLLAYTLFIVSRHTAVATIYPNFYVSNFNVLLSLCIWVAVTVWKLRSAFSNLNWITGHTYIYMVRCGSDYSLLGEWRPICTCERAGWCWMVQLVSSREYQFLPEYTVLLWPDTCSKYWRVDRLAKSPPLAPIVYSVGQPRGGGR